MAAHKLLLGSSAAIHTVGNTEWLQQGHPSVHF